ncbi:MAG TPA: YajQ family cyclic di-GMP-binding protein, partial [Candidatus Deferrimicrobiaceae bacterium]|nr:YajQ family cyclic di-GMP-binding protein [Candidatus Deferrimicrobiaceae bacterium]
MPSFDIVSTVDMQEVDNAVNQTIKEIGQRYDFKGSKSEVLLEKEGIKVVSDDDFRLKAVLDVLQTKCVKRGISLKALEYGKVEPSSGGLVRRFITIRQGIPKEKGREIIALIKGTKLKVQSQMQEEQVRVTGKSINDLQEIIRLLKAQDLGLEM